MGVGARNRRAGDHRPPRAPVVGRLLPRPRLSARPRLSQAPTQLRLTFSEQVDSAFSQLHVLNARRVTVDRGDSAVAADDPRAMVVSLQPGLADGVYTVAWRTLSADDGHSESGAYRLVFGTAAGAVGVTQPQSSAAEFSAETALGRWWLYLAASLVFGPLLAWQIVFRPLLQGGDSAARLVAMGRTRPLVLLGTLALVAGTLYAALAQAASASGLPLWSVVGRPLHDVLTTGHYASIWWPRLSLALICLVLLAWHGIDGLAGDLVLAMMPAVLLTSSLASHAAALPGWSPLAIGADWLHFMAVTAWLGGLASMVEAGRTLFQHRTCVCCRGRADWHIPGVVGARLVAGARPDRVRPEHLGEDRAHHAHARLRCIQYSRRAAAAVDALRPTHRSLGRSRAHLRPVGPGGARGWSCGTRCRRCSDRAGAGSCGSGTPGRNPTGFSRSPPGRVAACSTRPHLAGDCRPESFRC